MPVPAVMTKMTQVERLNIKFVKNYSRTIKYKFHVVAEIENSDHSLFEVKRVFHDGKWNEIEGNTVVLPNKSVYFDFRFNYDVNNLFLEVKDGLDNSYYYEIKVLSLNLLPDIVRNSNTELLHTIRELKEISIDEINKKDCVKGKIVFE